MAILDNSYRKCYNKCNDDNKKAICHQSPKFALYGVFVISDIKSRRTPENAVQRIYIKYGNTKWPEMYVIQGQREKSYLYIQKRHFLKSLSCGYKIVIILPLAFPLWRCYYNDDERRKPPETADRHKLAACTLIIEQTSPEKIPCRRSAAFQRTKARENPLQWRWTILGQRRTPTNQPTKEKEKRP